jgi:hypothetical protein
MMTTMMMMSVVVSIKTQHTPGAVAAACEAQGKAVVNAVRPWIYQPPLTLRHRSTRSFKSPLAGSPAGPGGSGSNAQSLPFSAGVGGC